MVEPERRFPCPRRYARAAGIARRGSFLRLEKTRRGLRRSPRLDNPSQTTRIRSPALRVPSRRSGGRFRACAPRVLQTDDRIVRRKQACPLRPFVRFRRGCRFVGAVHPPCLRREYHRIYSSSTASFISPDRTISPVLSPPDRAFCFAPDCANRSFRQEANVLIAVLPQLNKLYIGFFSAGMPA